MVFAEFLPEGDISITGLPGSPLVTYKGSNSTLAVYAEGHDAPVSSKIARDRVWDYLVQRYPDLLSAHHSYHWDNNGLTWTETGAVTPSEAS